MMSHMIKSQLSHTKLNTKMLYCKFSAPTMQPSQIVLDFLRPFYHLLEPKHLRIEVIEATVIPEWVCTDWDLFRETLFHLLQNGGGGMVENVAGRQVLRWQRSMRGFSGRTVVEAGCVRMLFSASAMCTALGTTCKLRWRKGQIPAHPSPRCITVS